MPSKKKPIAASFSTAYIAAFIALHEQFSALIARKPWELIHESVLVGVQHPDTGEVYYAYFMGELGQVVGFNLYDAVNVAFWRHTLALMQEDEDGFSPLEMLSQTFLQFTAGKKSDLAKEVIALHDAAGITVPRGKAAYTEPVRYEAGYAPSLPDEAGLLLAEKVLPGLLFIVESVERGIHADAEEMAGSGLGLVAFRNQNNRWELETRPLPSPQAPDLLIAEAGDAALWTELQQLPRTEDAFAFHAGMLPVPFAGHGKRGTFLVMLLCVSLKSGVILHFEHVPAPEWKQDAAAALAATLTKIGGLPKTFAIADGPLRRLMEACGAVLSVPVVINEQAGAAVANAFDYLSANMGMAEDF